VRFAVNHRPDEQLHQLPSNPYAGYPSLNGLGYYFQLDITVGGLIDPRSGYLVDIKQIDQHARHIAIPLVDRAIRRAQFGGGGGVALELFRQLRDGWNGPPVQTLNLALSPFLALAVTTREYPMIRMSQKFEFAASHRLHNPAFSDEQNHLTYGKCNNPHGHGHNYELQVTLVGEPDSSGVLMDIPHLERIVAQTVIERFDHHNLNVELPEFHEMLPSVENIARVIYRLLKPRLQTPRANLASVTVWETPKTWCEYSE
jgi:6-pyruvoyltetrahydropterin/6-carboxytetrahydropterin synthase